MSANSSCAIACSMPCQTFEHLVTIVQMRTTLIHTASSRTSLSACDRSKHPEIAIAVGRWTGRSEGQPYENITDINISHYTNQWCLHYNSRQYRECPVVILDLGSDNTFTAAFSHWIISTPIQVKGYVRDTDTMALNVSENGMTGLETYQITLRRITEKSSASPVESRPYLWSHNKLNEDGFLNGIRKALLMNIQADFRPSANTSPN